MNALAYVSDCVMVNGGEKERGARGWGNGWIICLGDYCVIFIFCVCKLYFLYFYVF